MIAPDDYQFILKRDKHTCQHPMCPFLLGARAKDNLLEINLDLHHIYWKSQYRGTDRDFPWNLITLHHYCHISEIGPHQDANINSYFRGIANHRKSLDKREGGHHPDLIKMRKKSRAIYQARVAKYKKAHGGLSPTQVSRRRKKAWLEENKS